MTINDIRTQVIESSIFSAQREGRTITLNWEIEGGKEVWIEQHSSLDSYYMKYFHKPEQVYGNLRPIGEFSITLPEDIRARTWFLLFVDEYNPDFMTARGHFLRIEVLSEGVDLSS